MTTRKIIFRMLCLTMAIMLQTLTSCAFASGNTDKVLTEGSTLPSFTLTSGTYGTVTPADLKGKVVLVTLFATWCPPCQAELAEIQKELYPKFKDNAGFRLLVIGREHTDADLVKYNKKKKFTFPLYPDPKREVFSLFADQSIPRSFLFDREGKLVYSTLGYNEESFHALMIKIAEVLK